MCPVFLNYLHDSTCRILLWTNSRKKIQYWQDICIFYIYTHTDISLTELDWFNYRIKSFCKWLIHSNLYWMFESLLSWTIHRPGTHHANSMNNLNCITFFHTSTVFAAWMNKTYFIKNSICSFLSDLWIKAHKEGREVSL